MWALLARGGSWGCPRGEAAGTEQEEGDREQRGRGILYRRPWGPGPDVEGGESPSC